MAVLSIAAATPALGLADRVFVSARSGNNANACDDINTPCQTFAGALVQLNPNGEVIVLDSGDYGPVKITKGVTIEAPAGVTAFIHSPLGDAIRVKAGFSDTVTLRGLTLSVGTNGIMVNSVGTLNVENCFITGFGTAGIQMVSAGRLNVKGTDVKACFIGIVLVTATGVVQATIDHCHLDGNSLGFIAQATTPGSSTTTATYSTASNNVATGWVNGHGSGGATTLNLEFCAGSENGVYGLIGASTNVQSIARYSNCVFANNGSNGVRLEGAGILETRGNNTITGNAVGDTFGTITPFLPM
jgi:hypothetical protein